jgi:hypothetical protein
MVWFARALVVVVVRRRRPTLVATILIVVVMTARRMVHIVVAFSTSVRPFGMIVTSWISPRLVVAIVSRMGRRIRIMMRIPGAIGAILALAGMIILVFIPSRIMIPVVVSWFVVSSAGIIPGFVPTIVVVATPVLTSSLVVISVRFPKSVVLIRMRVVPGSITSIMIVFATIIPPVVFSVTIILTTIVSSIITTATIPTTRRIPIVRTTIMLLLLLLLLLLYQSLLPPQPIARLGKLDGFVDTVDTPGRCITAEAIGLLGAIRVGGSNGGRTGTLVQFLSAQWLVFGSK